MQQRKQMLLAIRSLGLAGMLAAALTSLPVYGQARPAGKPAASRVVRTGTPYKPHPLSKSGLPPSAQRFYESAWGVEVLGVKAMESGAMLRFSYRVLDTEKAQPLNDKKATPYLYDLNTRARLEVPSMEKVGQLRQSSPVEEGHVYWMVFSNAQRLVKPGARVDVSIGEFRAQGLVVE